MKIHYTNEGWICCRDPYYKPIENEEQFIEVDEEDYNKSLSTPNGYAWKVVDGKLSMEVYDQKSVDEMNALLEIMQLKEEIIKVKEDVEQVELFGMSRDDYQAKRARCVEIILRLRELEKNKQ